MNGKGILIVCFGVAFLLILSGLGTSMQNTPANGCSSCEKLKLRVAKEINATADVLEELNVKIQQRTASINECTAAINDYNRLSVFCSAIQKENLELLKANLRLKKKVSALEQGLNTDP